MTHLRKAILIGGRIAVAEDLLAKLRRDVPRVPDDRDVAIHRMIDDLKAKEIADVDAQLATLHAQLDEALDRVGTEKP